MTLVGHKELLQTLRRLEFDAPVAVAFGMYEGMQEVMKDAKARAPKDTEAMAKSGYVTPPEVRAGSDIRVESGFGGMSEDYVVRQHEDMTLNHPNGGEAKFFERAIDAGRGNLMAAIRKHTIVFFKTGKTMPVKKEVPAGPWEVALAEVGG